MRVLITTDTIGGVWTFTQELAAGLLERDHPVLLVSFGRAPSGAQREQCEMLAQRYEGKFRYVGSVIALEWMDANERVFEEGSRFLMDQMSRFRPDLIHSNQYCYGALNVAIPRIVTAHSDVLSWARACRGEPLPDSPWLRRYVSLVRRGLADADAVAAPTLWMMHALAESFVFSGEATIISNGRSIAVRFEQKRELRAVTLGRLWDEAKDVQLLKDVQSPIPIVVGGETRGGNSSCEVKTVGAGQLIGSLSEAEVIDLLGHSSIYLCLSRYEPFGLAPLEAALCGCAIVARDISSLHEVWGDAALYFRDARALSALLKRLHGDPRLLNRVRKDSYQRAQRFTRDRMVEQYLELFQRATDRAASIRHAA